MKYAFFILKFHMYENICIHESVCLQLGPTEVLTDSQIFKSKLWGDFNY